MRLCTVVPLPNHDTDWIRMMMPFMMNQFNWSRDPELRDWLRENRLDGFSAMVRSVSKDDAEKQAILERMKAASMPAMAKLTQLLDRFEYLKNKETQAGLFEQKVDERVAHDFGAVDHRGHFDVFIGLMGQFQDTGAVGDAVFQMADAVDVFLIVTAGGHDVFGGFAKGCLDRGGDGGDDGGVFGCHCWDDPLDFANVVLEIFALGFYLFQHVGDFLLNVVDIFFDQPIYGNMRALSGTIGLGRPVKPASGSDWPPWKELMFSVD